MRAALAKSGSRRRARPTRTSTTPSGRSSRRAVVSDEVIDIFAAAGLKKPDISILSDEFLAEVRGHAAAEPRRGAAAEAAQRRDQGRGRKRTSSRRARSPRCWSSRCARYQNRAIETAQVIEELIELAKDMREAQRARRGAWAHRRRARLLRRAGGQRQRRARCWATTTLRTIARELVETVRKNVTHRLDACARTSGRSCG